MMSKKGKKKHSNINKIIIAVVTVIIVVYIGIRIESKMSNYNSGTENMPTIYPNPYEEEQVEGSKEPQYKEDDALWEGEGKQLEK